MLDENEWVRIEALWKKGFDSSGLSIDERFRPLSNLYEEITGVSENNHLAIMHHRISQYGDPCENCGKPMRTPQAAFCPACNWQPPGES